MQFYNNDGKILSSKDLSLEPYERVDELIDHYFDGIRLGTIIVSGSNASLLVNSHILDLKNGRHLGRAHAQIIK